MKKLKVFTIHEEKLSNCIMIMLQLNLQLSSKQNVEKDLTPITLAQVKGINNSESLLNKVKQLVH